MCPLVREDQDWNKPVTQVKDDYLDSINRTGAGTVSKPETTTTPAVPKDYVDDVLRDDRKKKPGIIKPSTEDLDREGHYLRDPEPLDREVGRSYSPPVFVGPPAEISRALPDPVLGTNPANTNLDDQPGLDLRNYGTDTRDPDAIFQGVAKGAEGEYSRMWGQAEEAKAQGDVGKGVFNYIGALGVKGAWGVFEGATFIARPWNWGKAGEGAMDLATDKRYYDSQGKEIGSARGSVISQFLADPVGGLAFGLGNVAGGMAVTEGVGKFTDMAWGKAGKATTLTDVTASVDEVGDVSLVGKSSVKKLPRGDWEGLNQKPNRLLITGEAEDVVSSSKVRTGAWGDVAMETSETRTSLGLKKGLILEMEEGQISDLTLKGKTQVKGMKGSFMDTPPDTVRGSVFGQDQLSGLLDFKETQLGEGARPGAQNYMKAGQPGLGMDDAWMAWSKGGEAPGKLSPWNLERPSGPLHGSDWMDFSGKVRGGARVIKQEPMSVLDDFDTGLQRPTGGPKTPLSDISKPQGWPSRIAQEGTVADVKRLIKTGKADSSLGADVGGPGVSSGPGIKASLISREVSVPTGQVSFFTPTATQWAPVGAIGSGLDLLGKARTRLDTRPALDNYMDSSRRVKPVTVFNPLQDHWTKPATPTVYEPLDDHKPKTDPLTDHWTKPWEDTEKKPLQDHWTDQGQDHDHPPPPPDPLPPPPTGGGGGGGYLLPPWGAGGALFGGHGPVGKARSRKKVYQVADPIKMIGGTSTIKGQKATKSSWKRMARRLLE